MDKRGRIDDSIMFGLILFVSVCIIAVVGFGFFTALPIFTFFGSNVVDLVTSDAQANPSSPLSNATITTLGMVTTTFNTLNYLSYAIFFGLFLGFVVLCFSVRSDPFMIWIWVIGIVIMALLGLFITVVYQKLSGDSGEVAVALQSWTYNHFILSNLPMLIGAIGVLGGIVLLIIPKQSPDEVVLQ